ncbi:MAG: thioredoxin family protein [Bacteroidota bacterium]
MKHLLVVLLCMVSLELTAQEKPLVWHTDLNKAVAEANQSNKPLLLFFTGSDWCGWCKRLQGEVFAQAAFKNWAMKEVVLVEVDFPRRTPQEPALRQQNMGLQQAFRPRGYPTIFFAKPVIGDNGQLANFTVLGQMGYQRGGANPWVAQANTFIGG